MHTPDYSFLSTHNYIKANQPFIQLFYIKSHNNTYSATKAKENRSGPMSRFSTS